MKREMGACIVELRGNFAAALTEDGRFVRIRNRGYEIGQTVLLAEAHARRGGRLRAFTAMAAGLLLLLLGGWKGYQTPVGVVSLDVNPSIEYTINCLDRVLSVRAVNDDAAAILERIDESSLFDRPVDEAVEQTIETLRLSGYFEQDSEHNVVLAASSYSVLHAEHLAVQLKDRVSRQADLSVTAVSVSREEVEQAHALGASAGKVRIVEQLEQTNQSNAAFSRKDWLEKPVQEILEQTREQQNQGMPSGEQKSTPQPNSKPAKTPNATPSPLQPKPTAKPGNGQQPDAGQQKQGDGDSKPAPGGSGGGQQRG